MSEAFSMFFSDCNGVRIELDLDSSHDPGTYFINTAFSDDKTFLMRDLKYIQVVSEPEVTQEHGETIRTVKSNNASFVVLPSVFLKYAKDYLQLQRYGIKWKSAGKEVNAGFIKKKIQDALLPFGISEKDRVSLYKQLMTYCFDNETVVEPFKAMDLSKIYEKPAFIVDNIMYPGLILFAAPSKTGKSFLCLDLACCVAEGAPFWGFKTDGGSVLYLALEDSEWRIQDRLVKVGRKSPMDKPERLTISKEANTIDDGLIKQLEIWLSAAENPKLVIIDTLQLVKGRSGMNESAYSADYRFMRPLHELALDKKICILCVTHTRKSTGFALDDPYDAVHGSVAQMGASDATWIISGKRGSDTKTFTATGRDIETLEYEIERGAGGKWIFRGTTEARQEEQQLTGYQEDPIVKTIRKQLTGSGGSWTTTAQNILEEVAKDSGSYPVPDAIRMSRRLRDLAPMLLEQDGIIVHLPNKYGGQKGRSFKFEQIPFTR